MRVRPGWVAAGLLLLAAAAGCRNPLGVQYEYEEQLYLSVNGAATVILDSSIPALVALRGLPLDPSPNARVDRDGLRKMVEAAGCGKVRVGQPWKRQNRHFVQVRISTDDVRLLSACGLLSWSKYSFGRDEAGLHYYQVVGAAAAKDPGKVNWTGKELVAFKVHVPSHINYHNVRRLDNGAPGDATRGNILAWEQTLNDRRLGKPIDMQARMDAESILYRTLILFGGAFAAALAAIAGLIWITVRRARAKKALG